MDIHHSESHIEFLEHEQAFGQINTGPGGTGAVSWQLPPTAPPLWSSNTHSNLCLPVFPECSSAETSPLLADMETWRPSTTATALHCYYSPVLAQDLQKSSEETLGQNWTRVSQSHEQEPFPEWTEDMATPGFSFRSYNAPSPNDLPAEPSMKVTGDHYVHPQYITESDDNDQEQYFSPDPVPLRVTYVVPDSVGSHSMHIGAHSSPMSSQSFRSYEDEQSVIKSVPSHQNHHFEITTPLVHGTGGSRRSSRLNPASMPQLHHEESNGRSMAPLVTPYYNTSLGNSPNSPICGVNSPYNQQIEPVGRSTNGYLQGQANSESPPGMSQGTAEFSSPGISASNLQRAASTGGLHFSPVQTFRGPEQHFWAPPRSRVARWSYTEPPSPAEDNHTAMHRDKHRRSSLKTCELEEAGLDFPGCYVLVPTTEGPTASEAAVTDGPEPGLISTKKNFRRPMVESERQAIKLNRKYGVCLRCKMFKERCRGGFPCDRCKSLKLWKNICVTAHFADKSIFSRGLYKARVSLMLENVHEWLSPDFHNQEVIEVGNGYPPKLSITLQKFSAIDVSLLEHILWRELRNTDFARIPSSSYGIIEDVSPRLGEYFDDHIHHLVGEIQRNVGTTVYSQIYAQTLLCAHKYTIDNPEAGILIRKALRIWAAQIVFFKGAWRISGKNTAGMPMIKDPKSTVYGITPLPRLANQQLDAKVESWIADLEQEVLLELQQKIFRRNPADWFGIYLTLFVTFSSLERDSWGLQTWATDSNNLLECVKTLNLSKPEEVQKAWIWPLQEAPGTLIERNMHLADTLAAHFRSVTKGYVPFTLDWYSDPVVSMAGGEEVAVDYMRSVGQWAKESDQVLRMRSSASYSKEVFDSFSLMYCSRLMVSEDT